MIADRPSSKPSSPAGPPRWGSVLSGCAHLLLLLTLARLALPPAAPPPRIINVQMVAGPPVPPALPAPAAAPPATPAPVIAQPPPVAPAAIATPSLRLAPAHPHAVRSRPAPAAAPRLTPESAPLTLPAARPQRHTPTPGTIAGALAIPNPSAMPDGAWLAAFTSRVQAAVQAAAIYPPAARLQRRQGRVRVRFALADGQAAETAILTSSTEAALDRAALRAVQAATYPPAPPALARTRLHLLVWVDFRLLPES